MKQQFVDYKKRNFFYSNTYDAVGDVHQLRAGLFVLEEDDRRADEREIARVLDDEALDLAADLGELRAFSARSAGGQAEQQAQRQQQA